VGSRYPTGRLLFEENFKAPHSAFFDDGLGGATRDCEIMLGGNPSLRIDCQAQVGTANTVAAPASPAVSAVAGGGTFAGGTTYGWKVTAHNNVGESVGSTEVTATPAAGGSANLTWTRSAGADHYGIYRTNTVGSGWLFVAYTPSGNPAAYTDTGTAASGAIPVAATTSCPGRTASTAGVVAKRRILDPFVGALGFEGWFRMTSTGLTSNTYPVLAIYNRDGTSAFHGRVWLNPITNNGNMQAFILDGNASAASNFGAGPTGSGAVWVSKATSTLQNSAGSHSYMPSTGQFDQSGGWHHVKLIIDTLNKTYLSLRLDGGPIVDLSSYALDVTTTSGAAMNHFSVEMMATTSTYRYMHWNTLRGTREL
jgi:hypothetical protein